MLPVQTSAKFCDVYRFTIAKLHQTDQVYAFFLRDSSVTLKFMLQLMLGCQVKSPRVHSLNRGSLSCIPAGMLSVRKCHSHPIDQCPDRIGGQYLLNGAIEENLESRFEFFISAPEQEVKRDPGKGE